MSILGSLTEIAAKTVDTGRNIVSSLGVKSIPKNKLEIPTFDSARNLLGSIYAMLVSQRALELKSRLESDKAEKDSSKAQDKQIKEIVKALSIRRFPKPKPKVKLQIKQKK